MRSCPPQCVLWVSLVHPALRSVTAMTSAHVTRKQEAVTSHCGKTQTRPYTEVNMSEDIQKNQLILCVSRIKLWQLIKWAWPEPDISKQLIGLIGACFYNSSLITNMTGSPPLPLQLDIVLPSRCLDPGKKPTVVSLNSLICLSEFCFLDQETW